MLQIAKKIAQLDIKEEVLSISEIADLGSVNSVFEIQTHANQYIIRINQNANKQVEYQKEKWCMDNVSIPTSKVLKMGVVDGMPYMIQFKIEGKNGKECTESEKERIWEILGKYARQFHQIKRIENEAVEQDEFHDDWQSKIDYNIGELHEQDSLLQKNVLKRSEHINAQQLLKNLKKKSFRLGLVHGDLCPRNIIYNKGDVHLLDWGTAGINVVPHAEIGQLQWSEEATEKDLRLFLKGLGISDSEYKFLDEEIRALNFLNNLDTYRWAETYAQEVIKRYEEKVKKTYDALMNA
jgi:Ser/Thr protein kinase RdoA (MazF antagonist)